MVSGEATQLLRVELGQPEPWRVDASENDTVRVFAPPEEVLQQVHSALASHAKLQEVLDTVRTFLNDRNSDMSGLATTLAESTEAMTNISEFLQACHVSFPTSMRPTAHSPVKTAQVFATAELFEAILLYLSPFDLLSAMRVNRAALQIFKDSPKLQDRLQLRARDGGLYRNVFSGYRSFRGFRVGVNQRGSSATTFNLMFVTLDVDSRVQMKIGDLCRRMLIIHPPLHSMNIAVSCCERKQVRGSHLGSGGGWGGWGAQSDAPSAPSYDGKIDGQGEGSKDATADDESDHSFNAKVSDTLEHLHEHASDGTVKPTVTFQATLALKKHDPYLIRKESTHIRNQLRSIEYNHNSTSIMSVYVDSKKRAFERDWPILTFEEFKARYDVDVDNVVQSRPNSVNSDEPDRFYDN